jgi:O-antigen/teichoic acid export membrane protein
LEDATSVLHRNAAEKQAELDRSLIHGVAWTGAVKWATQIVTWGSTLAVAHILSPADYGVVTLATVYLGVVTLVSDFGVGAGVVALRDQTDEQLAQLNGLAVLVGVAGFVVSGLIARPAGRFFQAPQLPAVLTIMSLSFVVSSFQSVPSSLLRKDLRFKALSVIDGTRALVTSGLVLALAIAGLRYWSLVLGALASTTIGTALVITQRRHRFALPRWSDLKQQIRFSSHISIVNLAWYWYSNADFVVAGRMLGQDALGMYSLAWQLANTPVEKVTSVIGSVTPAYFSAVQNDPSALKRYLLKPTEAISLILFPVMIGMALVAHDAVPLLLGSKWQQLVVPLQLLAIYATFRCVMPLLPQVLVVSGDTIFLMWSTIITCLIIPIAFIIGSRWGTSGIAAAWVLAYPINAIPMYVRTARRIRMSIGEYLRALRPAIDGCVGMTAAVLLLKWALPPTIFPLGRLLAEVSSGALVYVGAQLLFHRDRVMSFCHSGKMIRAAATGENG